MPKKEPKQNDYYYDVNDESFTPTKIEVVKFFTILPLTLLAIGATKLGKKVVGVFKKDKKAE